MPLQVKRLARPKGIKYIIRRSARRSWPVNYGVTYQTIHGFAEALSWNLKKHGITDVSSGDIHHWKMPLSICILNLRVAVNKRKSHRSFQVAPDTISNENRWVIVTSSIHEPLATLTSYWPIILTLFMWRLSSDWRCQPGTFQHGGSSSRHLLQCIASFSW